MTEHKAPRRMGPTRAQLRLRGMKRLRISRGFVQLAFVALIVTAGVRHQLVKVDAPSVDALCPFGAVQDALTWVRRRLHLPTVTLPASLDRGLRWGRFVVLAIVLYFSVTSAKLWFAGFDPYLTLFSFHWLFEFDLAAMWVPLTILALILGASLVVDRFWCRYLCPLGATFAVVGHLSVFRIRRSSNACTDCTLCDRPCPVGIEPSNAAPLASTDCIGCLDCVAACPVKGALKFDGPVVLGMPLRKDVEVASAPRRSGTKVPS